MKRVTFSQIGLLLSLVTSAFQSHCFEKTWLDLDFIETAFVHVAFRNEYQLGARPLRKWLDPVAIYVDHQVPETELHQELLELHIAHLAKITRHPIQLVESRELANVIWIFTQESEWQQEVEQLMGKGPSQRLANAICKAGFSNHASGEIFKGSIVIPVDKAHERGKLLACIVEEITQVMGLPNDSKLAYPSIFNDHSPEELLSPLDIVLLQLLYEQELSVGLTEAQAMPIMRKILTRYQNDGTLDRAVKEAKSAGLYQLVGY